MHKKLCCHQRTDYSKNESLGAEANDIFLRVRKLKATSEKSA
jgi:hypothetical protein